MALDGWAIVFCTFGTKRLLESVLVGSDEFMKSYFGSSGGDLEVIQVICGCLRCLLHCGTDVRISKYARKVKLNLNSLEPRDPLSAPDFVPENPLFQPVRVRPKSGNFWAKNVEHRQILNLQGH